MNRLFVVVFMASFVLMGCVKQGDVKVSPYYVDISGVKYRKTAAIHTKILWAGKRVTDGPNSFEPKELPTLEEEIIAEKVTIAFNEETKKAAMEAAAEAGLNVAEAEASIGTTSESSSKGTFHVFKLLDVSKFVAELNSTKNKHIIDLLRRYKDPRIITGIAVVFDRSTSQKLESSGNFNLAIKKSEVGNPTFKLNASKTGQTICKLSDGTVFGYEYSKLCWEKHNGTLSVLTLEVDRPYAKSKCPAGTDDNPLKLQ